MKIILIKYIRSIIFFLIFLFLFALGMYLLSQDSNNSISKKIKDKVPYEIKFFLKKSIFYIPYVKRELKKLNQEIQEISEDNEKLILERDMLENLVNNGKYNVENINSDKFKFFSIVAPFHDSENLYLNKKSGYIEIYKNFIINIFSVGKIIFIDKEKFYEGKLNFFEVNSNLKSNPPYKHNIKWTGIKDILIVKDDIYISLTEEIKNECYNTSLYRSKINFKFMNFEKIYGSNDCSLLDKQISSFRYFNGYQTGGRILNVKDKIYLTIGDYNDWVNVQTLDKINGKIIEINPTNKAIKIISTGHRNPQGLDYLPQYNSLISTEHGPKGGDEINLIDLNKSSISNYGWPISSYGNHYSVVPLNRYTNKVAPLKKSHKQFGFIEPLKYFKDSIGISEVIINYYENNSIFVTSLKSKTIFEIKYNKSLNDLKIVNEIPIGERIRDMIYDKENDCYIIYGESTPKIVSMCLSK